MLTNLMLSIHITYPYKRFFQYQTNNLLNIIPKLNSRIVNNVTAVAHNKYAKRYNAFLSYSLAHENFVRELFIANGSIRISGLG